MSELAAIRSALRKALITSQASIVVPLTANAITLAASSGIGAFGAWTTVQSSGLLISYALTMVALSGQASQNYQVQVGTGAAGAEVPIADFTYATGATVESIHRPIIPAPQIPTNERLAMRYASPSTGASLLLAYAGVTPRPF